MRASTADWFARNRARALAGELARDGDERLRTELTVHVAYNLLHLVPGETGGAEVYARRLLPALRAADPDLEMTLFLGGSRRKRGLGRRRRRRSAPVRSQEQSPPRARGADALAARRSSSGAGSAAQPLQHGAGASADPAGDDDPRRHLQAPSRERVAGQGRRGRRSPCGPPLDADRHRLGGVEERPRPLPRRSRRERSTSRRSARACRKTRSGLRRRSFVASLGIGDSPLVLSVLAKRPHKNAARLIEAFAQVPEGVLVIPGYPTGYERELDGRIEELELGDRVRLLGWVDDATLDGLYRAADCFVFPSLAEGFGLPVLEAMLRGAPVACSNATSLPEVAGDAALLFDPLDVEAIAVSVRRILEDRELAERLRAAGLERAQRFSWEETAQPDARLLPQGARVTGRRRTAVYRRRNAAVVEQLLEPALDAGWTVEPLGARRARSVARRTDRGRGAGTKFELVNRLLEQQPAPADEHRPRRGRRRRLRPREPRRRSSERAAGRRARPGPAGACPAGATSATGSPGGGLFRAPGSRHSWRSDRSSPWPLRGGSESCPFPTTWGWAGASSSSGWTFATRAAVSASSTRRRSDICRRSRAPMRPTMRSQGSPAPRGARCAGLEGVAQDRRNLAALASTGALAGSGQQPVISCSEPLRCSMDRVAVDELGWGFRPFAGRLRQRPLGKSRRQPEPVSRQEVLGGLADTPPGSLRTRWRRSAAPTPSPRRAPSRTAPPRRCGGCLRPRRRRSPSPGSRAPCRKRSRTPPASPRTAPSGTRPRRRSRARGRSCGGGSSSGPAPTMRRRKPPAGAPPTSPPERGEGAHDVLVALLPDEPAWRHDHVLGRGGSGRSRQAKRSTSIPG